MSATPSLTRVLCSQRHQAQGTSRGRTWPALRFKLKHSHSQYPDEFTCSLGFEQYLGAALLTSSFTHDPMSPVTSMDQLWTQAMLLRGFLLPKVRFFSSSSRFQAQAQISGSQNHLGCRFWTSRVASMGFSLFEIRPVCLKSQQMR